MPKLQEIKLEAPLRFNPYHKIQTFSPEQWDKWMTTLFPIFQQATSYTSKDHYASLHTQLCNLTNVQDLCANHLMGIMALAGIVNPKMFDYVIRGAQRGYTKIKEKFKNVPSPEKFHENLKYALAVSLDLEHMDNISDREAENMLCKIGRVMSNYDKRFWDVVDVGFPLAHSKNGIVTFELPDGKKLSSKKGMFGVFDDLKEFELSKNMFNEEKYKTLL